MRIAKALAGLLVRMALGYFRRAETNIIRKINTLLNRRGGVTISLIVKLPTNIVRTLIRARPGRLIFLIRSLVRRVSFSVAVTAGYNM